MSIPISQLREAGVLGILLGVMGQDVPVSTNESEIPTTESIMTWMSKAW